MALMELIRDLYIRAEQQRIEEGELLEEIEKLSDSRTAERAKDMYDAKKHAYSFDEYLKKLSKLKTILAAGVPAEIAVKAAESCLDADTIAMEAVLRKGNCKNSVYEEQYKHLLCIREGH